MMSPALSPDALAGIDAGEVNRLLAGDHDDPHHILGAHPASVGARTGVTIRAMHPDAVSGMIAAAKAVRPNAE